MEKREPGTGLSRDRRGAGEVAAVERGVAVHIPIPVFGKNRLADQRGRALGPLAGAPQREADVLLAVGAGKMLMQEVMRPLRHRGRTGHTWMKSRWTCAIHAFALRSLCAQLSWGRLQYCQPCSPKMWDASVTPPCGNVLFWFSGRSDGCT